MNNTDEFRAVDRELAIGHERRVLEDERTKSRKARRAFAAEADAETVQQAQQAFDEARKCFEATRASLVVKRADLEEMTRKQQAGDRSVTASDVREVKDEIETLTNYLGHDEKEFRRAERALNPLLADQHLAGLAADLLESVTDVPVIIRRKVENAPDICPAIVLSQTEPTENYGTLNASGVVNVTEIGQTGVDWQAVQAAFDDLGCQGRVSKSQIIFEKALWDVPRLAAPSVQGIGSWMRTFENAWHLQISGAAEVERLRNLGYGAAVMNAPWSGMFARPETALTFDDGKAVGTATVHAAAQQEDGTSLVFEDLKAELTGLVKTFREETLGAITEAGEIVSVAMSEVEHSHFEWDRDAVAWRMGGAVRPITAETTITIEFAYDPAEI